MNKVIFLLIVSLSFSCARVNRLEKKQIRTNSTLYFSKVKVSVKSELYKSITLRGYISLIIDTNLCFKFYGPLSYELLSGSFDRDHFKVYDSYNKRLISSDDSTVNSLSKFRVDGKVLESLITGRKTDFIKSFRLLNREILIDTSRLHKNELSILDDRNNCKLQWIVKDDIVKSIVLNFSNNTLYYVRIDLIAWNNERRICKFRF